MDKVPAFMKLTAERVAKEGLDAMFAGKRLSIPSKRYKVLVFLMTHFPFLINIFSNSLTGGRYDQQREEATSRKDEASVDENQK